MIYTEITFEEIDYDDSNKIRMNSFNQIIRRKTVYYFLGIPYRTVCYQRVNNDFWKKQ